MDKPESTNSDSVDEVLAHYGVLGMHWGTRKTEATAVVTKERPGKKLKTSGGKRAVASEDAKKVAVYKQTAKKSTTDSLSTKELTDMVNRLNMEQQYNRLVLGTRDEAGKKFVGRILKNHGAESVVTGGGLILKSHPATRGVGTAVKVATVLVPKGKKKN